MAHLCEVEEMGLLFIWMGTELIPGPLVANVVVDSKHFWDGKEYDNLPEAFPVLEWGGRISPRNSVLVSSMKVMHL